MEQTRNLTKPQWMTRIAILSAIAFILMYIELPIPIVPPWLKLDFSDIPALLSAFALGPVAGCVVQGIKCVLFFIFKNSGTAGVGELANFLIGVALVIPAGLIYLKKRTFKGAVIAIISGLVCACVAAGLLNYYMLIPFYAGTGLMPMEAIISICSAINPNANSLFGYVIIFAVPFTAAKLALDAMIVFLLYKKTKLHRWLHK